MTRAPGRPSRNTLALRRATRVLLLAAGALLLAGCPARNPARPAPDAVQATPAAASPHPGGAPAPAFRRPLAPIEVVDLTTAGERPVALSAALEPLVREAVQASRHFRLPAADAPASAKEPLRAGFALFYALVDANGKVLTAPAPGTVTVGVRAELRRARLGDLPETYGREERDEAPFDPTAGVTLEALMRERLRAVLSRVVQRLGAAVALRHGTDAQVLAALRAPDAADRLAAVEEAGERTIEGALEPLLACLRDSERAVRLRAIGALVQLRDPRAAKGLAAVVDDMDVELSVQALTALGDIGGSEARRYLELIAASHPLPAVRAEAARLRER